MTVTAVNQLWVADITYIRLRTEFVFLAVVIDRYSRKAIGWALDRSLTARVAVTALEQAIGHPRVPDVEYELIDVPNLNLRGLGRRFLGKHTFTHHSPCVAKNVCLLAPFRRPIPRATAGVIMGRFASSASCARPVFAARSYQ